MKKSLRYIYISLFCILTILFPIKANAAGIMLDKSKITLGVGYPETLTYTLDGNLNSYDINWTSSNEDVAVVNKGKVIAISEGTAIITASINGMKSTCKVTVVSNHVSVIGLTLNKNNITMLSGNTEKLTATINPSNATNQTVIWTSSNPSVASVSSTGLITAKSTGNTTITATISGIKATCNVSVTYSMTLKGISLNKTEIKIKETNTEQLSIIYNPTNATNKKITWKSSDENIATVSSTGLVTAKSKGSATITAISNDGGYTATCKVVVEEISKKVTGVKLNKKEIELLVGESSEIKATITPEYAENKKVKWTSSDKKIATVEDGKIKALYPGKVEIKATTEDGNQEAICSVTVLSAPVEKIEFKELEKTVFIDSETEIELITTPENSVLENPIWTSSDETIAIVENGKLLAKSLGEVTITISNEDNTLSASMKVIVIEKPKEALDIKVEGYNLKFKPNTKNYNLSIGNESELKITTNIDSKYVNIKGNQNLKNGSVITITINDGEKITYVINIKKKQNYTIYFIAAISLLLLLNLIRILIKQNKKTKNKF